MAGLNIASVTQIENAEAGFAPTVAYMTTHV